MKNRLFLLMMGIICQVTNTSFAMEDLLHSIAIPNSKDTIEHYFFALSRSKKQHYFQKKWALQKVEPGNELPSSAKITKMYYRLSINSPQDSMIEELILTQKNVSPSPIPEISIPIYIKSLVTLKKKVFECKTKESLLESCIIFAAGTENPYYIAIPIQELFNELEKIIEIPTQEFINEVSARQLSINSNQSASIKSQYKTIQNARKTINRLITLSMGLSIAFLILLYKYMNITSI